MKHLITYKLFEDFNIVNGIDKNTVSDIFIECIDECQGNAEIIQDKLKLTDGVNSSFYCDIDVVRLELYYPRKLRSTVDDNIVWGKYALKQIYSNVNQLRSHGYDIFNITLLPKAIFLTIYNPSDMARFGPYETPWTHGHTSTGDSYHKDFLLDKADENAMGHYTFEHELKKVESQFAK